MSEQLEKLKKSINLEYTKEFELDLMKSSGFIPVNKKQDDFYIILNKNNFSEKSKVETLLGKKYPASTFKFIPVEARDFEYIFSSIFLKEEEIPSSENFLNISAEDMLVEVGWLTRQQLNECIVEASSKKVPVDMIFNEKAYLSYERIVSYLKKKYSVDVISKADIKVDESILKLLPDDFIEKKKVVILTVNDDKLNVAMVNPSDNYTVREISLSTGRSLNVCCIPSFEFDEYLKEYLLTKKSAQVAKETERIIQSIEEEAAQFNQEESLWAQVEKELQDSSGNVAKLVYIKTKMHIFLRYKV
mgnify:CR=1 FL=1